jgi:hypothetical protein
MAVLNRSAIVVKPRLPFLEWLHSVEPKSRNLTLQDLQADPNVYLLPECEDDEDLRVVLQEVCDMIFEEELSGWITEADWWPAARDLRTFERWFAWSHHSMLFDLCEGPLNHEDL